ncbi:hypothetical protein HBB16_15630 [Pseudonocardia sp. MCCB 268]|nr:hypothetical protein [Pseudonocardia cytotoxica]
MLAEISEGVASRAQLLALGSARTRLTRCRPGGPRWKKLVSGIVQLDGRRTTRTSTAVRALLHAGAGRHADRGRCRFARRRPTRRERRIAVLTPAGRVRGELGLRPGHAGPITADRSGATAGCAARPLPGGRRGAMRGPGRGAALFADAVQRGCAGLRDLTAELDEPGVPTPLGARAVDRDRRGSSRRRLRPR